MTAKHNLKRVSVIAISGILALSAAGTWKYASAQEVQASGVQEPDTYKEIRISPGEGQAAIQNALNEARDHATDFRPYKIILESGSYEISHALHIYSNTYLDAGNAYLHAAVSTADAQRMDNLLKTGTTGNDSQATGYYYKNITINGGVWDRNGGTGTALKIVHAKDVAVTNAELCNACDSHLIETAAVDGLTVSGCYFHDSSNTAGNTNANECIQLDVLATGHINGYANLDNERKYVSRNITISNCRFENVERSVGSHTAIYGIPFRNVKILNNEIQTADCGLLFNQVQNLVIQGNHISCQTDGVKLYNVGKNANGIFRTANQTGTYSNPKANAVIADNTITSENGNGIYLNGTKLSSSVKGNADTVPAGDYAVQKAAVKGNTIRTKASQKSPVLVTNGADVTISGNKIKGLAKDYFAIYVKDGSRNISITKNTVSARCEAAIRTFDKAGYGNISVKAITNNNINVKKGNYGISIGFANVKKITSNKLKNYSLYGIRVDAGSTVRTLKANTTNHGKKASVYRRT